MMIPSKKSISVEWPDSGLVTMDGDSIRLNVYIEDSGSMDGYMCDGSQLKDAVYSYISALDSYCDTTNLFYINQKVIPYKSNIKGFVKDLTPIAFAKAGGNRANSDISEMFSALLDDMTPNSVVILVSDCILDVPDGDAAHFWHLKQTDIRNTFNSALNKYPNLSVEVFRLESLFTGNYYYTHGHEKLSGVLRPYFMFVIGSKENLSYLNDKVPFEEIQHGIKNYFAFSTLGQVNYEFTNSFGMNKGNSCSSYPQKGSAIVRLQLNMRPTLQDDAYLSDIQNYVLNSSDIFINNIASVNNKKSPYSHVITLAIDENIKPSEGILILKTAKFPSWLEAANDETGQDIQNNLDKTTGIKYIINGIAESYKNYDELAKIIFTVGKK